MVERHMITWMSSSGSISSNVMDVGEFRGVTLASSRPEMIYLADVNASVIREFNFGSGYVNREFKIPLKQMNGLTFVEDVASKEGSRSHHQSLPSSFLNFLRLLLLLQVVDFGYPLEAPFRSTHYH
jgi:hypothetical protein